MPATAGRKIRVKASSAGIAFTAEAFTNSGDNKTYQITNAAKRVWDRTATITVKEDGIATVESYTINRLSGKITFAVADALRGVVTADGTYLPVALVAEAKDVRMSFTAQNGEDPTFGDTDVTRLQIGQDVSGSVGRWYIDSYFSDALAAGAPVVVELYADDAGTTPVCKVWALFPQFAISGARSGLIEESIDFEGVADADGRSFTFDV